MKKFLTLFIVAVVAISMNAMPQVVKAGKKMAPASPQREARAHVQSKIEKSLHGKRVNREKDRARLVKAKSTLANPTKVSQAVQETIVLNFDEFYEPPYYWEDYGEWACTLSNGEYYVFLDWYGTANTYCGTYTLDNFNLGYTYIETPEDFVDVEDITMTIKEEVVSQYLKTILLDATILGYNGNTYEIHLSQKVYSPKSTVESVVTGASLQVNEEDFVLTGKNEDLDFTLTITYPYPAAAFSKAYFDMENSKVTYKGVEQELLTADLVNVTKKQEDGTVAWVSTFEFYNQDTVLHTVNIVAPFAAPVEVVETEITNLEIDDSWSEYTGSVYLFGANTEYDVYLGVPGYALEAGTYSEGTLLYITDLTTYEEWTAFYCEATLKESETSENGWECDIVARCGDNKEYKIHMTFKVPEPTQFVDVTFENACIANYYPEYGNDLQFANYNDEYEVSLDILDVPMGGTFTMDNMDLEYTWLYVAELYDEVSIASINGELTQNGDTTVMKAAIITFDAVQYNVELWYVVPTPTDTVELVINNANFVNQIEASGMYQIAGYNADSTLYASFLMLNAEQVAGTYVNEGKFSDGVCDLAGSYSYVFEYIDKETGEYETYSIAKGEVNVAVDNNDAITLTASVICSNAVLYNITMTSEGKTRLDYDAKEGAIDRTFTAEDNVTLTDGIAEYGMVYWSVKAADGSDGVAMYFFVETADPDIVIPVGTYTIDYSEEYGTVLANSGVEGSSVYPSYYANYEGDGILVPLWFFVGGTVEVSKNAEGNLHLEINAYNSYEVPIHIIYDASSVTGLENVNVEDVIGTQKMLIDNQVVIIRNGEAFSIVGTRVK